MFDSKNGFHPRTVGFLMAFAFVGLLSCVTVGWVFFGDDVDTPRLLCGVQIFFAVVWFLTFTIVVPLQILYFRRKNRVVAELGAQTTRPDLVDVKVPTLIAFPVLAFLSFLIGVFLISLALGLLAGVIDLFVPE